MDKIRTNDGSSLFHFEDEDDDEDEKPAVTTMKTMRLTKSPFLQDPARPAVHVAGGHGAYGNTREALGNVDLSPARGTRVLLKPNAGRVAPPGTGITTDPHVVAAVIDAFLEEGAEVAVGESPITGVNTAEAFEETGIAEVAGARDCALLDMDARDAVRVAVPEGKALRSLAICSEVFEFDILVSIPVVKMHMHTGVSLAVKNMKGCLWRRSKVALHMLPPVDGIDEKPIDIAIADLAGVLRPHLAVIDGSVGMEGMGPSAGKARSLGITVVSADAFAADAVACRLMGLRAEEVPHLKIGAVRGYGVIDLLKIEVSPAHWEKWAQQFERPPENVSVIFPQFRILDEQSCSACQSTLYLFLKRYGDRLADYFPADKPICMVIGKGNKDTPENALRIGNCALCGYEKDKEVPGCPPVASEILRAITGTAMIDELDGRIGLDS